LVSPFHLANKTSICTTGDETKLFHSLWLIHDFHLTKGKKLCLSFTAIHFLMYTYPHMYTTVHNISPLLTRGWSGLNQNFGSRSLPINYLVRPRKAESSTRARSFQSFCSGFPISSCNCLAKKGLQVSDENLAGFCFWLLNLCLKI
jgi:hypothetical protein